VFITLYPENNDSKTSGVIRKYLNITNNACPPIRSMNRSLRSFVCLAVLVSSCSLSQLGWKSEGQAKSASSDRMIEDFDPLTLDDDDIVITPKDTGKTAKSVTASASNVLLEEQTGEKVDGYRVQLVLTKSVEGANEVKKKAIFKFEDKVYLVFETPYYKVQLGDFESKKDAEALRDDAIAKGFPDTWVVRTQIEKSADSH
jgi:hypothetical protein